MLDVKRVEDGYALTLVTNGPVVYLDQWVWCDLSQDLGFRQRLLMALRAKKSAIAYSFMNLAELSQVTCALQQEAIAEFADAVDYAFVDSDPSVVSRREDTDGDNLPCFDAALVRSFLATQVSRQREPKLTMSSFLRYLRSPDVQREMATQLVAIEDVLEPTIQRARGQAKVVEATKRRARERRGVETPASVVTHLKEAAIDWIVSQPDMRMGKNEWIDLFHTIVPVAYCHFVLLDRRWAAFVRECVKLQPPRIAHVYSKKTWPQFVRDLANVSMKRGT